jgi:hypothetical protein
LLKGTSTYWSARIRPHIGDDARSSASFERCTCVGYASVRMRTNIDRVERAHPLRGPTLTVFVVEEGPDVCARRKATPSSSGIRGPKSWLDHSGRSRRTHRPDRPPAQSARCCVDLGAPTATFVHGERVDGPTNRSRTATLIKVGR